jgi:hypothetical protein
MVEPRHDKANLMPLDDSGPVVPSRFNLKRRTRIILLTSSTPSNIRWYRSQHQVRGVI